MAIMFSERVSTHLTGRSSSRATRTATMSSGAQCLAPNEPPTCGAISRTRGGLEPEVAGEAAAVHVRHLAPEVHGELVTVAVVARDHRDRRALHGHDRDPLVLEAPAHDHVGAVERVDVVGLAPAISDVGLHRVEL